MKRTLSILCLMTAVSACSPEFTPESLVGENWHTILNIKNNGEQEVPLTAKGEVLDYRLVLLKSGSHNDKPSGAQLKVMEYGSLSGRLQGQEFEIIAPEMYEMESEVEFHAQEQWKSVPVRIRQAALLDDIRKHPQVEYILPLMLVSDRDSVNTNKNYVLLRFADGDLSRQLPSSSFEIIVQDLPANGYGDFGAGNLFDGNPSTVFRSVFWEAKAVNCSLSEGDTQAFWCNREDHDESDYVFVEKFTNKVAGEWVDCPRVELPWNLVVDMKEETDLTEIRTTVGRVFDNGVDLSSCYQRVKEYEYWISSDNQNWELFAKGTIPVYGPDTYTLRPENKDVAHPARFVRLSITSLHWRQNTEEEMKAIHSGKAYNEYHDASFCSSAASVAKDPDYAQFEKSAAVALGPVILGELEFWGRKIN